MIYNTNQVNQLHAYHSVDDPDAFNTNTTNHKEETGFCPVR